MEKQPLEFGIEGLKAPELDQDIQWVDGAGLKVSPIKLAHYKNKFKVIYCFQSWCRAVIAEDCPRCKK